MAMVSSILVAGQGSAQISANVALTSDYVWRGISQNNGDLALQGGFDYTNENGFYAGTWGSNVSFGNTSTELDLYLGWTNDFESGLGLDVGVIQVLYLGASNSSSGNYKEAYFGLSHSGFSAKYVLGDEFSNYWETGYEHSFDKVTVGALYGDYDTYSYYKVGISGEIGGIGVSLDFWDTDSTVERILPKIAGSRISFSISKSF